MRLAKLLISGLVTLGVTAPLAWAAMPRFHPYWGVTIQAVYDQHGDPVLGANFSPNGGLAKPHWRICAPPHTSVCEPAGSGSQELSPGATSSGTVFRATATYKGRTYVATSAVWEGQVRALHPPDIEGEIRVGARVNVTRATWGGGWRPDPSYHPRAGVQSGGRAAALDELTIEACETRVATQCLNLTPAAWEGTGLVHPLRIEKRFKGWYLFGFDQHFSGDTAFATPGYMTPEAAPTLTAGPTVARSEPYGPIR
jgi:hypothetical protein